jgi:PKD repeat protein
MKPSVLRVVIAILVLAAACKKDPVPGASGKKPFAGFSFTIKNAGVLPDTVTFVSTSSDATSFTWNFGDGGSGTGNNPQHVYSSSGNFNVKLVVTNQYGSDSITQQVSIVLNKPTANFTFTLDNSARVPCNAVFTSTSVNASNLKWYFSDIDTSNKATEQRLLNAPRTYSVKLVATNATGKDSITKLITVTPILKSVVVYLITPRDKQFNPAYYTALKNATLNLQAWYKSAMGNNKTFTLNPLVLDTLTGLHDSAWYNSANGTISGTDPRYYGFYNTYYEMQQLLGSSFSTSNYVYFVYVAAPGGGAGSTGFCAMGDQDLLGLLGKNPENLNINRWIGGGGHELGHSFGLPHPDNQNGQALMWTGYLTYPNCILQQSDKDILNASLFFK